MRYVVKPADPQAADFTFYGGARDFARCKDPEVILHGPAETGKTISALWKIHLFCCKYPGARVALVRKVKNSLYDTAVITLKDKVFKMAKDPPVAVYGGEEKPQRYRYSNGSTITLFGMDSPEKLLSGEFDLIYVVQAEELSEDEWQTLTTRATGRAGNAPYAQTTGDCNPAYPQHWIYTRETLVIFYSKHQENPTLFDQSSGEITEQGRRTMRVLRALRGVRRIRLLEGRPAIAEGAVYEQEWDEILHRPYGSKVPPLKSYFGAQDWGYSEPGCLLIFGIDWDGRLWVVRQYYMTQKTIDWWVIRAKRAKDEFKLMTIVCDPSEPANIAKYRKAGINAIPAYNRIKPGIDAVKTRLAPLGPDNEPDPNLARLFIVRESLVAADPGLREEKLPTCLEDEIPGYVWSGKDKEIPVDENNHGCDALRYGIAWRDKVGTGRRMGGRAG